jgi:anaphase-promoting complex subunit 1
MLTLGTCSPLLGTKLPIPDICLAGRVPPNNATVQLDTTSCSPTMKAWPDFHNGVAAGLRLTGAADGRAINRTWIVYNRPSVGDSVNYSHGGLLMALGLRGHLGSLAMTDIYEYLTQGSDTTTVGVLLGMAATKRATCDPSVSKMLCLHIPSLLPPPFTDMDVSSVAQIAAVAGVGLLYQGSAHRLMTEFLLGEIGRKPTSDRIADREAYVLAAGFALGMVNLGKGKTGASAGLQDLKLEERLTQYLLGGKDTQASSSFRGGEDTSQKCSRIFEGDNINIDVTSPGATMALGLLHIKSGNKNVANRLSLPQTAAELDLCRPDFLLLRVVARALVLWDQDIEPTSEWVQRQIPDVVSRNWARLGEGGGFFKVAFGVANMTIEGHGVGGLEGGPEGGVGGGVDDNVDEQTVKQAYVHLVAGACFALGLRFAGTGNVEAKKVIMKEVLMLKKLREDNDRQTMARKPAKAMIDMCVGAAAASLSMVMAGTGDIDTVKLIRQLRLKCEGVTFGTHACLGSALGLLFLGGGSCTLGRSNEDIAALLVAFYPRWPISSTDHQFHLQVSCCEDGFRERGENSPRFCLTPILFSSLHPRRSGTCTPWRQWRGASSVLT